MFVCSGRLLFTSFVLVSGLSLLTAHLGNLYLSEVIKSAVKNAYNKKRQYCLTYITQRNYEAIMQKAIIIQILTACSYLKDMAPIYTL